MALIGKTIGQLTYLSGVTNNTKFPVELNGDTYHINFSAITAGVLASVTYSELVNNITGETLTAGSYYIITDFQTCYDQPDFDVNGNAITVGNYKTSEIEPIIVFATSANTISSTAYQPKYPNDRIQYDWTFSTTEVTSGTSYGRISERIDEFNNRTDYDHRTILFKRYKLFTYREQLNGTIELISGGTVNGVGTSFNSLTVGDVVYLPNVSPSYFEIVSISSNTLMTVSGDTTFTSGAGQQIYNTIEETNDSGGYFSYKQTNVKTDDYLEYTTFGDAISESYAKNNYVGNYANTGDGTFILANNVFLEGGYESNKFGDYCYNNTFGTDNSNNVWGDWCLENVSVNDIDDNIIGHNFYSNLINTNLTNNHIGNGFGGNRLLGENGEDFEDNIIGNNFNDNTIYSWFRDNEVLNRFQDNTIGDVINLDNFQFTSNRIGKNFENNTIVANFVSNNIQNDFYGNNISDGFQYNQIGSMFNNNTIGENFGFGAAFPQGNKIGNNFSDNIVGEYFYNNSIPDNFQDNEIGDSFQWNIVNAEIAGTCLSTGMLYDPTTVNVFRNKNGDDRLSYYDEVDVLTIETLTEAPCLGGLNALDVPENDLNFGLVINLASFTITSSDFSNGYDIDADTTPLGVDGVDGFENTASQNDLIDGYYGTGLSGTSLSQLTTAYNNLGLELNNSVGRLWYVTWGSGSSINQGIVKFGSNVNGASFDIQTIDTTDPAYLENGNSNGTSLVGTFLFPATFTIYQPITDKNTWC
jgi:hypothetical protein